MMSSNTTPSFTMNRATPATKRLIEALMPHAVVQTFPAGVRLPFNVDETAMCYLILEGTVQFHRAPDGLIVSRVYSPAIPGIIDMPNPIFRQCWVQTLEPCQIAPLEVEKVYEIIREHQLWELLVQHMNSIAGKFYAYQQQLSSPSAYELIRHQLTELMTESEAFRANTTVESYIRGKTTLSRSGIMRILAELKTGGYVEMHEGRLVKIIKLPAKY